MEKTKECSKCGVMKSLDSFYKDGDRRRADCKKCCNSRSKKYYDRNKGDILEDRKEYYEENKEEILKYSKEYYVENAEDIKERVKGYYQNNKEEISRKKREYEKRRLKEDPEFRIIYNLRRRVRVALINGYKNTTTKDLLGCSIKEWRKYLEERFTEEMSWDNYGSYWHIDHIKPCAEFDLTKESEQKKCFHYTNTQPLTVEENLSKGASWEE